MRRHNSRAYSLIEVLIASTILSISVAGAISGLVFSVHTARLNTNSVMAKNIAQGYFERMHGDRFARVSETRYPDTDYTTTPSVYLDEALNIKCKVDIDITGYGRATGGGGASLTDSTANWVTDEWKDQMLYLIDGPGEGQFAAISSNSSTTIQVSGAGFSPSPGGPSGGTSGTAYLVNNGKTINITTYWKYRDKEYSQSLSTLLNNYRNDDELGF